MKSYRKELYFNIPARRAYVNITAQVQGCIDESGIKEECNEHNCQCIC